MSDILLEQVYCFQQPRKLLLPFQPEEHPPKLDQLMLWTAGVRLTSGTDSQKNRFDFRKLINPVTVSILLAVICVLTGIRLPDVLNNSLQKIGQTATPLAMIYLGGVFACIDVLKNIRRLDYYGIVILKMLLFPLFFYVLLGYLPVSSKWMAMSIALQE